MNETNLNLSLYTGADSSWYRRVLPFFGNPRNLSNPATALWAIADEVVKRDWHGDAATIL